MNKNYIVSLVVLVLLGGGLYYYYQNGNNDSASSVANEAASGVDNTTNANNSDSPISNNKNADGSDIITVVYNGTSFVPASVTVLQGDAVTFINQSSGQMSVASNPHPMHTDYPEFDQYKSSQRGQNSYTFTFEKIGTWGYHNHLNPAIGGTITVIVGK